MLHKIKSIKHSGTCGERGTEENKMHKYEVYKIKNVKYKIPEGYDIREIYRGDFSPQIGRTVKFVTDLKIGSPLKMRFMSEPDYTPMSFCVMNIEKVLNSTILYNLLDDSKILIVETEKTIFEFEKVDIDTVDNVITKWKMLYEKKSDGRERDVK